MTESALEALFEKVVARISSPTDSSSNSINIGNDTKLRLYGLYKHCTAGPCPAGGGSSWNPTQIAKRRAWQTCRTMDQDDARMEYVTLAASLDETCHRLLQGYQKEVSLLEASTGGKEGNEVEKEEKRLGKESRAVEEKNEKKADHQALKKQAPQDISQKISDDCSANNYWLIGWLALFLRNLFGWILPTVQPVIPRGGLDISWPDLWFALCACFRCCLYSTARRRQLEDQTNAAIESLWKTSKDSTKGDKKENSSQDDHQQVDVVVGYSVRSLLDLYLMHKQFPPQAAKEVVVVPPINIPGMIRILEHYGLVVVPLDTPPNQVDPSKVAAAISDRTVAIMVVHPFGATSLSPDGFLKLRSLADKHSIEIWEDAAESYQGIQQSVGSPHADVTFLSFGLIKTATALGGGIAILREQPNKKEASKSADAMRRLQNHHYPLQTTWQYFWKKAMQAMLVQVFSSHPILYGYFVQLCLWWSGYAFLDRIITQNLRSIIPSDSIETGWLRLIRMRPSLPLLQLLHHRLRHSTETARTVQRRVKQCRAMTETLRMHAPNVGVLPEADNPSTYWLYPIQVDPEKKLKVQSYLLKQGWDIAAGTSQLQCVLPISSSQHQIPKQADDFMKRVLYLPVASRDLTRQQCIDLARNLERAVSSSTQSNSRKNPSSFSSPKGIASLLILALALCLANGNTSSVIFSVGVLFPRALSLLFCGFFCMMVTACCLQWLGGSLYLQSSTAFAQYNSMVDSVCSSVDEKTKQSTQPKARPQSETTRSNAGVIESMPALELPNTRKLEKGFDGCAILTGATGFCGALILRDLLLHRKTLNIEAGVFVICRRKRSKSAQERIARLLEDDMFSFLTAAEQRNLVHVLEGDVTQPNAGLLPRDMERLLSLPKDGKTVTHIIHSAASVSFTQSLADAACANITSALTMQALARRLGQCLEGNEITRVLPQPQYIHLSTAFVHGANSGTKADPLPQRLFPLDPYDPAKLYESMLGTQFYASKAMNDLRFHNTYAFTKCVTEHLLLREDNMRKSGVKTLIIRPSIVGPSLEYPREGWAGPKPSTIVAAGCLYLSYQWNLWRFGRIDVPCIPVDVLSRFALKKAFEWESADPKASEPNESVDTSSSEYSFERVSSISSVQSISRVSSSSQETHESISSASSRIYTAAWDDSSAPTALFTWFDYCGATLQLGAMMGYFYRSTAYIGLWITGRLFPRLQLSFATYEKIHYHLVQGPMKAMLYLCRTLGWRKLGRKLSKLSSFLDLPLLFFPYMNETYHFESELSAPTHMHGRRYAFSCIVEAHRFLTKLNARNNSGGSGSATAAMGGLSCFVIGGRQHQDSFDLWWTLTQPKGDLVVRLAAWLFAKILKAACYTLSVDLTSFEAVLDQRIKVARTAETDQRTDHTVHLVLAPTHRSFFDFVILSYLAFAIPELHIDIPMIAAADDFESLPIIGWLARILGAFYLRRGRGRADPELVKTMTAMKERGSRVFEVFIEGSRSRDRRFLEPRTGLLRCLAASGGLHLIVPISISYERLPEQAVLPKEASSMGGKRVLNAGGLLRWLMDVVKGKVCLGKIHVEAAEPSLLDCKTSSDYLDLARSIQVKQQQRMYCSEYHLRATAKLLGMDEQSVQSVMTRIGCPFWPGTGLDTGKPLALPDDPSELCTLMLHLGHFLAKLCSAKPHWRRWLDPASAQNYPENDFAFLEQDVAAKELSDSLLAAFAKAEDIIERAYEQLALSGFQQPNLNHLKMTAFKLDPNNNVPCVFLSAGASMRHAQLCIDDASSETTCDIPAAALVLQKLAGSEERLGFWGFYDSGFALQVNKKGSYFVSMRGDRYSISGKVLSKLLPFVEEETRVQINPFSEAFNASPTVANEAGMESILCGDGLELLQSTVGKIALSVADRIRHGTGHAQEDICAIRDSSGCNFRIPDAVVWPASENELEKLIILAKERQWCLIPFGGGTNVTQSTRCPPKSIEPRPILSVDMTRMNRLLWLNEEDGLACFEAGINGRDLVEALGQRGYTMGHEPDSIEFSTLGGWVATKASGMKRNRYGNIEDIVRDVRVAGASGAMWQKDDGQQHKGAKPVFGRESCGLDFKSLLLGSEGCLGIITSAVVKVWKMPEVKEYESVLFTSFEHGLGFVRDTAKLDRLIPASVRLLDNEHFRLGQALQAEASSVKERMLKMVKALFAAKTMDLDPKSVACATICYEGSQAEVQLQKAGIQRAARDHGGILLGSQIGKAGYDMTFMIAYLRDFALTYHFLGESFETFAPWSKVTSIITKTKEKIRQEHEARCLPGNPFVGCRVTQLYHDGACLYFYFCMNIENVKDASRVFSEIEHSARSEILNQGGSLSHHHGIGKVRAGFLKEATTPEFQKIVSSVKESMDPDNIFAAGNGLFGVE